MDTHELILDLEVGKNDNTYIDVGDFDICSVQFEMLQNTSFDSGVITYKKSNSDGGPLEDINSTPVTSTNTDWKQLTAADWQPARYLVLDVTTSSSSTAVVKVTIILKRGF